MSSLYSNLAEVYEMMYHTFINYDEEFSYYNSKLMKYNVKSLVEFGCGTGNLAERLIAGSYLYTGVDLNEAMLEIAKGKNTGAVFIEGDMRDSKLYSSVDACLFTGRTSAYLVTNSDVLQAFHSINSCLNDTGIVCFDVIDATKFIPIIKNGYRVNHFATCEERRFQRESYWSVNESHNWTFNWDSVYYEANDIGEMKKIGEDKSTIRSFTKDEMCLFLELCNFTVKEIEDRASYAFDTFVIVAQKNS